MFNMYNVSVHFICLFVYLIVCLFVSILHLYASLVCLSIVGSLIVIFHLSLSVSSSILPYGYGIYDKLYHNNKISSNLPPLSDFFVDSVIDCWVWYLIEVCCLFWWYIILMYYIHFIVYFRRRWPLGRSMHQNKIHSVWKQLSFFNLRLN